MTDLVKDIVEFFLGERRPMKRQELCLAIIKSATHNKAWPKATMGQWEKALATAIKRGDLVLNIETVWPPVKEVVKKCEQGELF